MRQRKFPTDKVPLSIIPSLYSSPSELFAFDRAPFSPYYSIQSIIPPQRRRAVEERLGNSPSDYYYLPRECADSRTRILMHMERSLREVSNAMIGLVRPRYFRDCAMRKGMRRDIGIALRAFQWHGCSVSFVALRTILSTVPPTTASESCPEGSFGRRGEEREREIRVGNNIETKSRINLRSRRCLVFSPLSDYLGLWLTP